MCLTHRTLVRRHVALEHFQGVDCVSILAIWYNATVNINLDNAWLWSGSLTQSFANAQVNITKDAVRIYAGVFPSEDQANFVNYGILSRSAGSQIGNPGSATTMQPLTTDADAKLGMNIVFDDAGSLFFGYRGTMRSGYSSHGINAGIRIEF